MAKALSGRAPRRYPALLAGLSVLVLALAAAWLLRARSVRTPAPQYLLKDCGGHPALYTAAGEGPLAVYGEIYTRLLPESDALALQQGLPVANEAALQRVLESLGM